MEYKVKVPDTHIFSKTLRNKYRYAYGDITVKVLADNVVSIKQKGNGLHIIDLIDSVLDITGGTYEKI